MIFHKQRREERTRIAIDARIVVGEFIQETRALRGTSGMLRMLLSDRSFLSRSLS